MERHNIVFRNKSRKLILCPEKREMIGREVLFHLGTLKRYFESGALIKDCVFNDD